MLKKPKQNKKQKLQKLSYNNSSAEPRFHLGIANTLQQIFPSDSIDATLMQNLINCHLKNS